MLNTQEIPDFAPLQAELSEGALSLDADIIAAHSKDEALFSPHHGAVALVRAHTVEDVQATLRFANERRIPVVPQGALSGISGGANASENALLLNVGGMKEVLELNTSERTITVQPGIINQAVKDYVAPHGLAYPPDPGSVAMCSIGGNIATNAGGLCCVKYGVTREYVRSIDVVLADGTLTTFGPKTAKGVAGLDMRGLFIGSEGTLGVVVAATLRLVPAAPQPVTAVAVFNDERSGLQTVVDFMGAGGQPSLFEFMDSGSIEAINNFGNFGLDENAGALLLAQFDASPQENAESLATFEKIAEAAGAIEVVVSDDPEDSEALIAARRAIQPANEKYAEKFGGGQLLDDVCLPRQAMPEFFEKMAQLRDETGVPITMVAHAGDGNTHPSVFFDLNDPESIRDAEETFAKIMQLGLDMGGTITGEHGVGYLKKDWLPRELDEGNRRAQRAVKNALDPNGILNPGKMLGEI